MVGDQRSSAYQECLRAWDEYTLARGVFHIDVYPFGSDSSMLHPRLWGNSDTSRTHLASTQEHTHNQTPRRDVKAHVSSLTGGEKGSMRVRAEVCDLKRVREH